MLKITLSKRNPSKSELLIRRLGGALSFFCLDLGYAKGIQKKKRGWDAHIVVGSKVIPNMSKAGKKLRIFLMCITIKLLSPDVATKDPGFVRFMTRSHRTDFLYLKY